MTLSRDDRSDPAESAAATTARVSGAGLIPRIQLAVLGVGIALRIAQLLNRRPLWLDEAWLSLNVLTRRLPDLLRPLDDNQLAPLGFLGGQWLVARTVGYSEVALRLIPFAAGVLALIMFSRLARRLLDPGAALAATVLAALSPLLIHYSAEAKSYGLDALAAILMLHVTLDLYERGATRRALVHWAGAAVFTALVSIPAPFIVAGCALGVLAMPELRRDAKAMARLAAACAPAALVFLVQWFTLYHSAKTTAFMQRYWAESFLDPHVKRAIAGLAEAVSGTGRSLLFGDHSEHYAPPGTMAVVLALAAAGTLWLARWRRVSVVALLAPSVLAVCAALLHRWPLAARLLLFAAPALLLTVPAGLSTATKLLPRRVRAAAFAGVALVLIAAMAIGTMAELRHPRPFTPLSDVVELLGSEHGGSATVYVSAGLVPVCTYYSVWHPDRARFVGDSAARECRIRGARTVPGTWPPDTSHGGGVRAGVQRRSPADWATSERSRILAMPSDEVWLLMAGLHVPTWLPDEIEHAGAVPIAERKVAEITIYRYRLPARPTSP